MFLLLKQTIAPLTKLRSSSWLAVIATELLVVVIGVYLADLLAERRDERFQRERQALTLAALDRDIAPFVEQADVLLNGIRTRYTKWTQDQSSGAQPVPFYVPATTSIPRPHGILWSSMLESGGLNLLPIELIADISEFYVRSDRMFDRYRRLDSFAQQQILPNLDDEPATFYADTTMLRPMYAIYTDELAAAITYAEQTVQLGKEIRASLKTSVR